MKRCYRCGQIECENCGGSGGLQPLSYDEGGVDCWRCKGTGWREAEHCPECHGAKRCCYKIGGFGRESALERCRKCSGSGVVVGTDPAVLCPACKEVPK